MSPDEYCSREFAPAGSDIYYATILLPQNKKKALVSMYAIHKKIESILSDHNTITVSYSKISWWKNQIHKMLKNTSDHPITKELSLWVEEYPFIYNELINFINKIESILEKDFFYSWNDLYSNYWTTNRIICNLFNKVFQNNDDNVYVYNEKIGIALQLTNSIQNIYVNAKNGFTFLPHEELNRFNLKIEDISTGKNLANYEKFMQFQINKAKNLYKEAIININPCNYNKYRESFAMAAINYATLEKISTHKQHISNEMISLMPIKKLWISWRTLRSNGNNFIKKLLPQKT